MSEVLEAPAVVNHSFSLQLPTLQLIIDQTSLGLFKECPRKYYYRMICGWSTRSSNVHLNFGIWFHQACETYEHAVAAGDDHQTALSSAVHGVLKATWDRTLGKPWNSENREKNRYTLIRSIVQYLDSFGQGSPIRPHILANGKPAVELTFKYIPIDPKSQDELVSLTGEPIFFAGHLDSIVTMGEDKFVSDRKTTSRKLGASYFAAYTPDNQFSMYSHAGRYAYNLSISGVICDAVQVAANYTRFERQIIYRTEAQLWEWYADAKFWIGLMGRMAEQNRWPQNDKSCYNCEYRPVCARTPGARETWLKADYIQSLWDPSVARE